MSITLRKQYSAKYQVLELTAEVENYEQLAVESANFDAVAKTELKKMVDLVSTFEETKAEAIVVPASTPKVKPISDGQKKVLAKSKDKAKLIAEKLGIEWKEDLSFSSVEAYKIINTMVAEKSTGF